MSSTTTFLVQSLTSPSPTPTSSDNGNNGNGGGGSLGDRSRNEPNTFYRNLFYILIGLLAAFGLISFLSLFRARHRRRRIAAEAARLGLLVPGMEGYIPIRDRRNMTGEAKWRHSDGRVLPDWWDVEKVDEDYMGRGSGGNHRGAGAGRNIPLPGLAATNSTTDFRPLAIIPPTITVPRAPAAHSDLAYFPHHLAYRPEDLGPLPTKFGKASESNLHELAGEQIEVVAVIRMPGDPPRRADEVDEGEEVLNEWGGVCVGVMKVGVEAGRGSYL